MGVVRGLVFIDQVEQDLRYTDKFHLHWARSGSKDLILGTFGISIEIDQAGGEEWGQCGDYKAKKKTIMETTSV